MLPSDATVRAPVMDPKPDAARNSEYVISFWWNTFFAKTGRKVIIGIASAVMQKAMSTSVSIAPCLRMRPIPCFMPVKIESPVRGGLKLMCRRISEIITATKDSEFNPKHQADPAYFNTNPPSTRAEKLRVE